MARREGYPHFVNSGVEKMLRLRFGGVGLRSGSAGEPYDAPRFKWISNSARSAGVMPGMLPA